MDDPAVPRQHKSSPRLRRHWLPHIRFSLQTLGLVVLTLGSALLVRDRWEPWKVERALPVDLHTCAFAPDGSLLAAGALDSSVTIWDMRTYSLVARLQGHTAPVYKLTFSPDGGVLATACSDATARLWDCRTWTCTSVLSGHARHVIGAEFSADGRLAITHSLDGTGRVWDVRTGALRSLLSAPPGEAGPEYAAALSLDGHRAVTVGGEGTVCVWDTQTGKEVLRLGRGREVAMFATFLSDGRWVLTAGGRIARLWDLQTGAKRLTLYGVADYLASAAMSADGRQLVTTSRDGYVQTWDAATGKEFARGEVRAAQEKPRVVAASPDGTRAVLAAAGPLTVMARHPRGCWDDALAWLSFWLPVSLAGLTAWSSWRDYRPYLSDRQRRRACGAVVVTGVLLVAQVATFHWLAEDAMPATQTWFLPQWKDAAGNPHLNFACVSEETWATLTPPQQEATDKALAPCFRKLYHSFDEIPETEKVYRPGSQSLDGLKHGCILTWELEAQGRFWFRGHYTDWRSSTGASYRSATFVWLLGFWVKLYTGSVGVS